MKRLVSHNLDLCVYWSPKAGCSTAVAIFFDHAGYDHSHHDWIHDARQEYQRTQPKRVPESCPTIQVTRNPYERAISSFFHYMQYGKNIRPDQLRKLCATQKSNLNGRFREFFKSIRDGTLKCENGCVPRTARPCCCRIGKSHSEVQFMGTRPQFIVKIENIEDDLKRANERFGLRLKNIRYDKHSFSKMITKEAYEQSREAIYSDDANISLIREIYDRDFVEFDYQPEWTPSFKVGSA
jgi:hypothetical protein